jgi:hypothetical protein
VDPKSQTEIKIDQKPTIPPHLEAVRYFNESLVTGLAVETCFKSVFEGRTFPQGILPYKSSIQASAAENSITNSE